MKNIGLILLAGGTGARMRSPVPKQFMPLNGKLLLEYSLEMFSSLSCIKEIVLVIEINKYPFTHAKPGNRRQDSVWNGLQVMNKGMEWICIHDAARPFILAHDVEAVVKAAKEKGAAALGVPVQSTIKQCTSSGDVIRTLDRSDLWEIQTPQVVRRDLLEAGFLVAAQQDLSVTDDLSLAELAGVVPKIVCGSRSNIKITTQEDLAFAEYYVKRGS